MDEQFRGAGRAARTEIEAAIDVDAAWREYDRPHRRRRRTVSDPPDRRALPRPGSALDRRRGGSRVGRTGRGRRGAPRTIRHRADRGAHHRRHDHAAASRAPAYCAGEHRTRHDRVRRRQLRRPPLHRHATARSGCDHRVVPRSTAGGDVDPRRELPVRKPRPDRSTLVRGGDRRLDRPLAGIHLAHELGRRGARGRAAPRTGVVSVAARRARATCCTRWRTAWSPSH